MVAGRLLKMSKLCLRQQFPSASASTLCFLFLSLTTIYGITGREQEQFFIVEEMWQSVTRLLSGSLAKTLVEMR